MSKVPLLRGAEVSISVLLLLAACASAPKNPVPPPAATPSAPVLDASYDWHGLLLLPFGSVLKDASMPLHEVLMFRDAAHAAQSDDAECYATERDPPRFVKQTPSVYLLCYKHDHLARIEASVNLPPQDAVQVYSDACGLWRRNSGVQTVAGAAVSGEAAGGQSAASAAAQTEVQASSSSCEGHDGAISYTSRLEENTDLTDRTLTIRLETMAQP